MSWDLCQKPIKVTSTTFIAMDYFSNGPKRMHSQIRKRSLSLISLCSSSLVGLVSLVSFTLTKFWVVRVQEVCSLLGIHKTRTTALHPQSDSMVEPYNRTIEAKLATFVQDHQRVWDQHLPLTHVLPFSSAWNHIVYSGNDHVWMGFACTLEPANWAPEYVERLRESVGTVHNVTHVHQQGGSLRLKRRYDMRIVTSTFGSGDRVCLHNPPGKKGVSAKLRQPWRGHMLLWNGLMMLCTGFSGALGKSLKWYIETAFGSTLG